MGLFATALDLGFFKWKTEQGYESPWTDEWLAKSWDNISRVLEKTACHAMLQKWLRDVHGIVLYIESPYHRSGKWRFSIELEFIDSFNNSNDFSSYEEALEAGLEEVFKTLK